MKTTDNEHTKRRIVAMCDCIKGWNEGLKEHGQRLSCAYIFTGPHAGTYPEMRTEVLEVDGKKLRGVKSSTIFPTYCPFCGVKYPVREEVDTRNGE
jgi:hypothetical protein